MPTIPRCQNLIGNVIKKFEFATYHTHLKLYDILMRHEFMNKLWVIVVPEKNTKLIYLFCFNLCCFKSYFGVKYNDITSYFISNIVAT